MFCPKCGANTPDGQRFCSECGADLTAVSESAAPAETPAQTPVQPAEQPAQVQPSAVQTPAESFQSAADVQAPAAPAKKKSKKGLFIGIGAVAAVAVVGAGIGGVIAYQNYSTTEYIKKNPTKAVYNSYETYLSSRNESTAGLVSILTGAMKKGTVSVNVDGNYDYDGQKTSFSPSVVVSYDKDTNEYYISADGLETLTSMMTGSQDSQNKKEKVEVYTNVDELILNYDFMGQNGNYSVDVANIRSKAEDSIFSPKKDNVLKISEEDFENFLSSVEKYYTDLKEGPKKQQESVDKIIAILEKYGKPEMTEETIKVRGNDRNVYTVTYTYDVASLKSMLGEIKTEVMSYALSDDLKIVNAEDAKKSVEEAFKSMEEALDSENINKDMKITLKNSFDKGSKEAAKTEISIENISKDEKRAPLVISVEYGNTKEIDMAATVSMDDDKGGVMQFTLVSSKKDSVTRYDADFSLKNNDPDNKSHDDSGNAFLEYDDANKTFRAGFKPKDGEEQSFSGKADISGNKASFSYEQKLTRPDESKIDYTADNIDWNNLPQVEYGSIVYTVSISSETSIKKPEGAKDIFSLSKEDFEKLTKSLEELSPGGSSEPFMDDVIGGSDSAESAARKSDAATIDNCCKTLYAGIVSGTITSVDNPTFPPVGSSASDRTEGARNATVSDALAYAGLSESSLELGDFGYDSSGTIYWIEDPAHSGSIVYGISGSTTLGEIYGAGSTMTGDYSVPEESSDFNWDEYSWESSDADWDSSDYNWDDFDWDDYSFDSSDYDWDEYSWDFPEDESSAPEETTSGDTVRV